jgi:hypothetical protein
VSLSAPEISEASVTIFSGFIGAAIYALVGKFRGQEFNPAACGKAFVILAIAGNFFFFGLCGIFPEYLVEVIQVTSATAPVPSDINLTLHPIHRAELIASSWAGALFLLQVFSILLRHEKH